MKKNIDVLKHMREDIVDIEAFVEGMDFDSFVKNHLVRKAVCMSLINIVPKGAWHRERLQFWRLFSCK